MGQGFDTAGSNETAAFLTIFITMCMYTTGGITINEIVYFFNDKFKAGLKRVKEQKRKGKKIFGKDVLGNDWLGKLN